MEERFTISGYGPGHPWFYVLGGVVLPPRVIREAATASLFGGYMADEIAKADAKVEPQRSQMLRALKQRVLSELQMDLSGYRRAARSLHRHRKAQNAGERATCADAHVAVSLKHNHLFNDFAHLHALEDLLQRQRDLFDL